MKTTFWVYLIGALALAGIPPLAGFFSKDEILAYASEHSPFVLTLLVAAAFLTAFYMGRQVWMVFFGHPRSDAAEGAKESPAVMTIPLIILAALSIVGGALNLPNIEILGHWLEHTILEAHHVTFSILVAGISVAVALGGILIAWVFYGRKPLAAGQTDPLARLLGPLFKAFEHKWWVDEIYDVLFLTPYKDSSQLLAQPIDQGVVDGAVNGLGKLTAGFSRVFRAMQNGRVRVYALYMMIGVAAIMGYLILR